jgi:hypothetical protein
MNKAAINPERTPRAAETLGHGHSHSQSKGEA